MKKRVLFIGMLVSLSWDVFAEITEVGPESIMSGGLESSVTSDLETLRSTNVIIANEIIEGSTGSAPDYFDQDYDKPEKRDKMNEQLSVAIKDTYKTIDKNTTSVEDNSRRVNKVEEVNRQQETKIKNLQERGKEVKGDITAILGKIGENKDELSIVSSKASKFLEVSEKNTEAIIKSQGESNKAILELKAKDKEHDSSIGSNTGKIATNTSKTEVNKTNISKNTINIERNQTNIASNRNKIYNNSERIGSLEGKVDGLETEMKKGFAMAAAMSSIDFQVLDIGDAGFGFGVGNYKNSDAVSLGVGVRPTENMTLNMKGAMSTGKGQETMVGGGAVYKFNLFGG